MEYAVQHPERFDPRQEEGTLIDTEHRARYWWASRAVAGKEVLDAGCGVGYGIELLAEGGSASVTGVDIDPVAVGEAEGRYGSSAEAIVQGDLLDLPFENDRFDVVICFETIEHVSDGGRALAELHRVLRPDGLLLVSSPNPDVYPPGNEHHVHEYRPTELAAAVGEHFSHVETYHQHAWLASAIEPALDASLAHSDAPESAQGRTAQLRRTKTLAPGEETYGIIVAANRRPPELHGLVSLGDPFEVGWWSSQLSGEKRAVAAAGQREAEAFERQRRTAASLLDANQELAQIPLLKGRWVEAAEDAHQLALRLAALEGSRSWRLTSPLRRLGQVLRWRRLG